MSTGQEVRFFCIRAEQSLGQLESKRAFADPSRSEEQITRREPATSQAATKLFHNRVMSLNSLPHGI